MDTFEQGTNFKAWIFTIARYEVQNFRRKAVNKKSCYLDEGLMDIIASEAAEAIDQTDERLTLLQSCLKKLNSKQKELIIERYGEGTSLAQFARESDQSPDSLRVTLFRIRNTLRKCVSKKLTPAQS